MRDILCVFLVEQQHWKGILYHGSFLLNETLNVLPICHLYSGPYAAFGIFCRMQSYTIRINAHTMLAYQIESAGENIFRKLQWVFVSHPINYSFIFYSFMPIPNN